MRNFPVNRNTGKRWHFKANDIAFGALERVQTAPAPQPPAASRSFLPSTH
jgi:hypothetical protein